jgi:hypothetical protein
MYNTMSTGAISPHAIHRVTSYSLKIDVHSTMLLLQYYAASPEPTLRYPQREVPYVQHYADKNDFAPRQLQRGTAQQHHATDDATMLSRPDNTCRVQYNLHPDYDNPYESASYTDRDQDDQLHPTFDYFGEELELATRLIRTTQDHKTSDADYTPQPRPRNALLRARSLRPTRHLSTFTYQRLPLLSNLGSSSASGADPTNALLADATITTEAIDLYRDSLPKTCYPILIDHFVNHQIQTIGFQFLRLLPQFQEFAHNDIDNLARDSTLTFSHIYGNSSCVNPAHIILESLRLSNKREVCHKRSDTTYNFTPRCLPKSGWQFSELKTFFNDLRSMLQRSRRQMQPLVHTKSAISFTIANPIVISRSTSLTTTNPLTSLRSFLRT